MFVQNFGGTNKEYYGIFESGLLYIRFLAWIQRSPILCKGSGWGVLFSVLPLLLAKQPRLILTQRMMKIGVERHIYF